MVKFNNFHFWLKRYIWVLLFWAIFGFCETPIFEIEIKDHLFFPAELTVPANTKIKLVILNSDGTPEEFESYEMNREKVIVQNSRSVIYVGPLEPGVYHFFGEFYPKTAQGRIIAE